MTAKLSIFRFVRTVVLGTLSIGLLSGGIGFLLAGKAGFGNFFVWGLVIGLFGSLILEFARLIESYGRDTFGQHKIKNLEYGWFVKSSEKKKRSRSKFLDSVTLK